jgi:hypothetical protein
MQPDAAPQPELLAGQSKAKIGILLANNRRNVISEGFWSAVVADLNILAPPVKVASCMTRPLIANAAKMNSSISGVNANCLRHIVRGDAGMYPTPNTRLFADLSTLDADRAKKKILDGRNFPGY